MSNSGDVFSLTWSLPTGSFHSPPMCSTSGPWYHREAFYYVEQSQNNKSQLARTCQLLPYLLNIPLPTNTASKEQGKILLLCRVSRNKNWLLCCVSYCSLYCELDLTKATSGRKDLLGLIMENGGHHGGVAFLVNRAALDVATTVV